MNMPPACVCVCVCGFSGENVRIVPGQSGPNGLESHLVQRYAVGAAPQVIDVLMIYCIFATQRQQYTIIIT